MIHDDCSSTDAIPINVGLIDRSLGGLPEKGTTGACAYFWPANLLFELEVDVVEPRIQ